MSHEHANQIQDIVILDAEIAAGLEQAALSEDSSITLRRIYRVECIGLK